MWFKAAVLPAGTKGRPRKAAAAMDDGGKLTLVLKFPFCYVNSTDWHPGGRAAVKSGKPVTKSFDPIRSNGCLPVGGHRVMPVGPLGHSSESFVPVG